MARQIMSILDRIRDKIIDYIFLAIILFVLLWGWIFPGSETNTPSSRDSSS